MNNINASAWANNQLFNTLNFLSERFYTSLPYLMTNFHADSVSMDHNKTNPCRLFIWNFHSVYSDSHVLLRAIADFPFTHCLRRRQI